MTLRLEAFEQPLNLIYEAALEPARWHEALAQVASLVGAGCFHFRGWDTEAPAGALDVVSSPHWTPALAVYVERFVADDPRQRVADTLGGRRWMVCAEHFGEREVARSPLWQELLVPWGLRYSMTAFLAHSGSAQVGAAFMRDRQRPFSSSEVAAADALLPHLQRASALMLRGWDAAEQQQLGSAALEFTHLCLLSLTAAGRLAHANPRAESLLRGQMLLTLHNGRLHAADPHADARLQAAIKAVAAGGTPRHLNLHTARGEPAWMTVMRPVRTQGAALAGARAAVLCVVAHGQRRLASVAQLKDAFDLSPAEARVARTLAQGGTLDDCARSNGVTRNTVKTQLARALAKMGLEDQRDLIRLLASLPAVRTP